jgi:hypothetical protein
VLVITAVAAWNVNLNSQSNDLSDISLANVEALAGENPMDATVWYVNASSSTAWTCTKPGTSACPAP